MRAQPDCESRSTSSKCGLIHALSQKERKHTQAQGHFVREGMLGGGRFTSLHNKYFCV